MNTRGRISLYAAAFFSLAACGAEPLGEGTGTTHTPSSHVRPSICSTADEDSRATVRIRVENHASTPRYLAAPDDLSIYNGGSGCTAFEVSQGAAALPLEPGFQCGCECPAPRPPHVNAYQKLEPGEAIELDEWDGRALADCVQAFDCTQAWGPTAADARLHVFRAVPQVPGTYAVKVGYRLTAPENCNSSDGVHYRCGQADAFGSRPGLVLGLCKSPAYASATVELPSSGEATAILALE